MKLKVVFLLIVATVMVTSVAEVSEAQLFQRQSCSGGLVSSNGLFSRIAQRRATRIQARTRTSSCSGSVMATSSCSGSGLVSYNVPQPQYIVPQVQSVPVAPVAQPVCNGPQCIVNQAVPVAPAPVAPVKSFLSSPAQLPTPSAGLFGLSASNDTADIPRHILAQIAYEPTFGLGEDIPDHILAQVDTSVPVKVAETFKPTLLKAIADGRKSGKLSFRDSIRLRVACLSPAFVERAHELAVTQIAMSGEASDAVPFDEEGVIQTEGINWEGLAKFLEAFIPLLITLLKAFGI